jgi:hypothetical protein
MNQYAVWKHENGRLHILHYCTGWVEGDSPKGDLEFVIGPCTYSEATSWAKLLSPKDVEVESVTPYSCDVLTDVNEEGEIA